MASKACCISIGISVIGTHSISLVRSWTASSIFRLSQIFCIGSGQVCFGGKIESKKTVALLCSAGGSCTECCVVGDRISFLMGSPLVGYQKKDTYSYNDDNELF
mgnify:CR=1 FL=1